MTTIRELSVLLREGLDDINKRMTAMGNDFTQSNESLRAEISQSHESLENKIATEVGKANKSLKVELNESLETKLSQVNESLNENLKTEISQVNENFEGIKTSVANVSTSVDNVRSSVANVSSEVANVQANVNEHVAIEIGKVNDNVSRVETNVSSRISEFTKDISSIKNDMVSLNESVQQVSKQCKENMTRIEQKLNQCSSTHDSLITLVEGCQDKVNDFEVRLGTLEKDQVENQEKLKEFIDSKVNVCVSTSADAYAKSILAKDRTIEISKVVNSIETGLQTLTEGQSSFNRQVDSNFQDVNKQFQNVNKQMTDRFQDVNKRVQDVNKQVNEQFSEMNERIRNLEQTGSIPKYTTEPLQLGSTLQDYLQDDFNPFRDEGQSEVRPRKVSLGMDTTRPKTIYEENLEHRPASSIPNFERPSFRSQQQYPIRNIKLSDIQNLETFDGSIEQKLPATYLQDVLEDLQLLGVSENQYVKIFQKLMRGSARIWFHNNIRSFRTFEDFAERFLEHFQTDSTRVLRLAKVFTRKYEHKDGSILDFFWRKVEEFQNLSPNLSTMEIISSIIGLLPYSYRTFIIGRQFQTLEEFSVVLNDIESYVPDHSRREQPYMNPRRGGYQPQQPYQQQQRYYTPRQVSQVTSRGYRRNNYQETSRRPPYHYNRNYNNRENGNSDRSTYQQYHSTPRYQPRSPTQERRPTTNNNNQGYRENYGPRTTNYGATNYNSEDRPTRNQQISQVTATTSTNPSTSNGNQPIQSQQSTRPTTGPTRNEV
mgnify:CR=1 FL=1